MWRKVMNTTTNGDISNLTSDGISLQKAGAIMLLGLNRVAKRNALNAVMIDKIRASFQNLPEDTRAVILYGEGEHFCSGLDLSAVSGDPGDGLQQWAGVETGRALRAFSDKVSEGDLRGQHPSLSSEKPSRPASNATAIRVIRAPPSSPNRSRFAFLESRVYGVVGNANRPLRRDHSRQFRQPAGTVYRFTLLALGQRPSVCGRCVVHRHDAKAATFHKDADCQTSLRKD
jgi:hypothetical protein